MAISKEKKAALTSVLKGLNKKFGDKVNFVDDIQEQLKIKRYKTPSLELNIALNGGIPIGKIVELYGQPSCGKTSLAMEIIKENQEKDPDFVAGWFETEESVDAKQLEAFGIDMERLVYWDQSDIGAEQGFDILRSLVESGEFGFIVVNSVAGLCATKEVKDEMEQQNIGLIARLMSKLFRVVTGSASKNKTTLLFINQVRDKVGVMFGNPETTTGGKALNFYSSVRIAMSKVKLDKSDSITEEDGLKVRCRVKKNRFAIGNPYKECDYYALYGIGIDSTVEIPNILEREGMIQKSGSWIYYPSKDNYTTIAGVECKWNSRKAFVEALKKNVDLLNFFNDIIDKLYDSENAGSHLSKEEIEKIEQEDKELKDAFSDDVLIEGIS